MSAETNKNRNVAVIGAGLAGLSCAVRLHEAGMQVEVFEASNGVGGRVRTDTQDGFLLDRGFQVYLDAYKEAGRFLDLDALDLRRFEPGALVWKNGRLRQVMDVFRRPSSLISSGLAPIGNFRDKLRVASLRLRTLSKSTSEIWGGAEETTENYLREFGFSDRMIDDFFRGFYGGIFLEDELTTSSRIFEFTFKTFSSGYATLPAKGMQAIPDQLAARLPAENIHLNCPVKAIDGTAIHLEDDHVRASHVVVATDGSATSRLIPGQEEPRWNSTSCLYFAAPQPPVSKPIIVLKGDRNGLINNLSVPSLVAPGYSGSKESLISISVLGEHQADADLTNSVQRELVEWFGDDAKTWQHLRTEHIRRALPVGPPGHNASPRRSGAIHICGDHTTSGSIEGAIQSGLRTADQILTESN